MIDLILVISILVNILLIVAIVMNNSTITKLEEENDNQSNEISSLIDGINEEYKKNAILKKHKEEYLNIIEDLKKQISNEKEVKEEIVKAKKVKTTKDTKKITKTKTSTNKKATKKENK